MGSTKHSRKGFGGIRHQWVSLCGDTAFKLGSAIHGKTNEIILPLFGKLEVLTNNGKVTFTHKTESHVMDQQ
ncbi:hypothetical protein EHS13_18640 [Paenibacillus psychroresistens]|uniref:Uncharacterized protein n=1 Tax=Paenibacillus psychroresistens TaxID=1778678 RepID=A0A6B8RM69_9BACL|nr:hypothetical protein [Paenibacillus psychroresistens]QGQ96752.1 hypothetical protein EHS13_18640 [Paenibacillus psychroresistens]